jgi:hypothetical protein
VAWGEIPFAGICVITYVFRRRREALQVFAAAGIAFSINELQTVIHSLFKRRSSPG